METFTCAKCDTEIGSHFHIFRDSDGLHRFHPECCDHCSE